MTLALNGGKRREYSRQDRGGSSMPGGCPSDGRMVSFSETGEVETKERWATTSDG
jgi:hypothetical protein